MSLVGASSRTSKTSQKICSGASRLVSRIGLIRDPAVLDFLVVRRPGTSLFILPPLPGRHRIRVLPETELIRFRRGLSSPVTGFNIDSRSPDIFIVDPAKALLD